MNEVFTVVRKMFGSALQNYSTQTDLFVSLSPKGNGRALRLSPPLLLFLSPLAERLVAVAMTPQRFVDAQTGVLVTRDDLLSVLKDVTSLRVRVHLNASVDGPIR